MLHSTEFGAGTSSFGAGKFGANRTFTKFLVRLRSFFLNSFSHYFGAKTTALFRTIHTHESPLSSFSANKKQTRFLRFRNISKIVRVRSKKSAVKNFVLDNYVLQKNLCV